MAQKTFTIEELKQLADEFLRPLDTEHHDEGDCERKAAAAAVHHFAKWLADRKHHYQDDGYLLPSDL